MALLAAYFLRIVWLAHENYCTALGKSIFSGPFVA